MQLRDNKECFDHVLSRLSTDARRVLTKLGVQNYPQYLGLNKRTVYSVCQEKTYLWLEIVRIRGEVEAFRAVANPSATSMKKTFPKSSPPAIQSARQKTSVPPHSQQQRPGRDVSPAVPMPTAHDLEKTNRNWGQLLLRQWGRIVHMTAAHGTSVSNPEIRALRREFTDVGLPQLSWAMLMYWIEEGQPVETPVSMRRLTEFYTRRSPERQGATEPAPSTSAETGNSPGNTGASSPYAGEILPLDIFSVRARNCLKCLKVRTVAQFLDLSEDTVMRCKNAGRKTWNEIAGFQQRIGAMDAGHDDIAEELNSVPADIGESSLSKATALSGTDGVLHYNLFTTRTRNCLQRMEVRTADQFMALEEEDVLECDGAGRKTWNEITRFQKRFGTSETDDDSDELDNHGARSVPRTIAPALAGIGLGHFQFSRKNLLTLRDAGVVTLQDALATEGRSAELPTGRTHLGRIIKLLNKASISSQVNAFPVDFSSFESMVQSFLRGLIENERNAAITAEYWGLRSGEKGTLESVAQVFDITRERVRQILKRSERHLAPPACLIPLAEFWKAADEILGQAGGLMSLDSFSQAIAERFEWTHRPRSKPLATLLQLTPAYDVSEKEAWVRDKSLVCPECIKAREYLHDLFDGEVQEMHFLDASHRLVSFCQNNCQERAGVTSAPDLTFFQSLITKDSAICYQDDRLLSCERWQLVYGKTLRSVVRATLKEMGEPTHYSKLAERIRQTSVKYHDTTDRNVHACLTNYSKVFKVAGRGTYALVEWEIKPYRSHAQAIIDLLTERGEPLTATEIIRMLTRDGKFKEINLNAALATHPRIVRIDRGLYDLRDRKKPELEPEKVAKKAGDIVLFFDDDDSPDQISLGFAPSKAHEPQDEDNRK